MQRDAFLAHGFGQAGAKNGEVRELVRSELGEVEIVAGCPLDRQDEVHCPGIISPGKCDIGREPPSAHGAGIP